MIRAETGSLLRRSGWKCPLRPPGSVRNRLLNSPNAQNPRVPAFWLATNEAEGVYFIQGSGKTRRKSDHSARSRSGLLGLIAASLPLPLLPVAPLHPASVLLQDRQTSPLS